MPGRLYELTLTGTYFQQETINRFNYITDVPAPGNTAARTLVGAFGWDFVEGTVTTGSLLDKIRLLVVTQMGFSTITCRDVYSDFDFFELPVDVNGNHAGDAMTPVNAYGFRTNRTRLDIHRGTKRFAGVSEGAVAPGGLLIGTGISGSTEVATAMTNQLVTTVGVTPVTFSPCVVGKEKYRPDEVRYPDRWAYRYWEDEAVQLEKIAQGIIWQRYDEVRSQTSRQYKKGR